MASKTKSPWYFFVGRENSLKGFGSVGMRSIYVIWIQKFFPYNHLKCLMGIFRLNSSVVSFQKWVWRFNQNNITSRNQKLSSYWPSLYISHKNPRCLIAWVFTAAGSSFIFLVYFKFRILCIPAVRVAITLLPPILYHHAILLHDLYLYSRWNIIRDRST